MKSLSILLFVLFLSACDKSNDTAIEVSSIKVEASLLVKDDVSRINKIPAVILAENRANLSFQLSGTVNQVLVKVGESVEQGQALISLYNPNIDPAVESNYAKLESIKAQILQAKRDVASLKALRENNSTSKNAYERNKTTLKDLIAQEKAIKAQIDLALANQSESVITAPFDGVVAVVNKQVGEFVAAGQVVVTTFQQEFQEVEVNLPQKLWQGLNLGDRLTADYHGQIQNLTVTELAQTADPKSRLMKAILALDTPIKGGIGQQLLLNVLQHYNNVYQLPLEVVVDDGINQPYIFTVVNGLANKHAIVPLFVADGNIVFDSVADIQYPVVLKGQSKISQGMSVQAKP